MFKKSSYVISLLIAMSVVMIFSNAMAGTWSIEAVDAPKYFAELSSRAIAIDKNGRPHIVYGYDHLYYAYYDGTGWYYETVDSQHRVGDYASIALDSNDHVHISYFDDSNGGLKHATNASGSWITETLDSSGLVGLYSSIALDSNDHVHISYFDFTFRNLKYATNASGTWVTETVDSTGFVERYSSIALDSDNRVHISYFVITSQDLKHATNASGPWVTETVDSCRGSRNSISIDANNNLHISYSDDTNQNLKYATNASGPWVAETVDSGGQVSSITVDVDSNNNIHISYVISDGELKYAANASGSWVAETVVGSGWYTSIALDSNNIVNISYYDRSNSDLKYVTKTSGSWIAETVDRVENTGWSSSIAIDSDYRVHISYLGGHLGTYRDLKYATNVSGFWVAETVDEDVSMGNTSIAIDSNKNIYISYSSYNGALKYATNASGSWVAETVDSGGDGIGVSSIAVDSNNNVHISYHDYTNQLLKYTTNASGSWVTQTLDSGRAGSSNSIAIDSKDKIHISYNVDIFNDDDLKYATNASGSWLTELVDSIGDVGAYTSIAVDSNNHVHISYCDFNNFDSDLKYATNASGSWVNEIVDSIGEVGPYTSIVIDSTNNAHIGYYDSSNRDLKYATSASGSWGTEVVDSIGDVGSYASVALDLSCNINISYYDSSLYDLKYATTRKMWIVDTNAGGDFQSIQAGIDAAADGDIVMVKDGTYTGEGNKNLDFLGKAIEVRSENGPEATIIDCENDGRGFHFHNGEISSSILNGFTISKGNTDSGGGIYLQYSSPTIINCIISGNSSQYGGGIMLSGGSARIANCEVLDNSAPSGGGIGCTDGSSAIITACRISGNEATNGGGMHCYRGASPSITNCIIAGNTASNLGGAIACQDYARPEIINCTIAGNVATNYGGGVICLGHPSEPTITNSILWGNTDPEVSSSITNITFSDIEGSTSWTSFSSAEAGIIDAPPRFVDSGNGNYHLSGDSPCINAGSNDEAPANDMDNDVRPFGPHVDMGADEYQGEYIDSDSDGLPDYWEYCWIGHLTQSGADDCDGDGVSNSQEYVNGSNPNDPIEGHIFVDGETGNDDYCGWNWGNAKRTIQAGIDAAVDGDIVMVKDGTYTGEGNKKLDFKGKAITVRSESGKDTTIIDCEDSGRGFYFHSGETSSSIVDGFTITNGSDDDDDDRGGGGVCIENSSPSILNCNISNCYAPYGGGIRCTDSSPFIYNCDIFDNKATYGAGIGCWSNSSPTINLCRIYQNKYKDRDNSEMVEWGGGIFLSTGKAYITYCKLYENEAQKGGGIHCTDSSSSIIRNSIIRNNRAICGGGFYCYRWALPKIINCIIKENVATEGGGAVAFADYAEPEITNCTIVYNSANYGGALYSGVVYSAWPKITNSILYYNDTGSGKQINAGPSIFTISFCCIENYDDWVAAEAFPGIDGGGNFGDNPKFRYPHIGDFEDGDFEDFRLLSNSPCIDTGANIKDVYSDYRGSIRPVDIDRLQGDDALHNNFDIGAYEYSAYPNGYDDQPKKAFDDVGIGVTYVIPECQYEITWSNCSPFPDNDRRITGALGDYSYDVRILLESENGFKKELGLVEGVPSQEPLETGNYAEPFTFTDEHQGTWSIRIEMADDPEQFKLSEHPVIIGYRELKDWVVGEEIEPPEGTDRTKKPEIDDDFKDVFFWYGNSLYPVMPYQKDGSEIKTTIGWYELESEGGDIVYVEGQVIMPLNPQIHVAGTAPVELLPDHSIYSNVELKYTNCNAEIEGLNEFSADEPASDEFGISVLVYWEGNIQDSTLKFEVIKTVAWNKNCEDTVYSIGEEIISIFHDYEFGKNGYVFNDIAPYAANEQIEEPYDGYDRETQTGPIVLVNKDLTGSTDDDLVVVWYQKGASGAFWPYQPVKYDPILPWYPDSQQAADQKIIIARTTDNPDTNNPHQDLSGYDNVQIYNQPDQAKPGFNPNEEHALIINDKVYALRDDLNVLTGFSEPFVLVKYQEPENDDKWRFKVFQVVAEQAPDHLFVYPGEAGSLIQAPYPLSNFQNCDESYAEAGGAWWDDYEGNIWAKKKDTAFLRYYYPLQEGFFYDLNNDGEQDEAPGTCIAWLDQRPDDGTDIGDPTRVKYEIDWPEVVPSLYVGETLIEPKNGRLLPDIKNQCSVRIIYDEAKEDKLEGASVKLLEVLSTREVALGDTFELPGAIEVREIGNNTVIFPDLAPHLIDRVSYDSFHRVLKFNGIYDDSTVGEPLLLLNIMNEKERNSIQQVKGSTPAFQIAVGSLYIETRKDIGGEEEIVGSDVFKVLTAAARTGGTGHVTLAFNGNEEFCEGNPVGLSVIKVDCDRLYTGSLKLIEPENVFDSRMTFIHTGDFAGNADDMVFEWKVATSIEKPESPDDDPGAWQVLVREEDGQGVNYDTIGEGEGIQTLEDKWVACHYRGYDRCDWNSLVDWSYWTEPQLYENWIKRVMRKINPFEQRYENFHEIGVATYVDMIQQAGTKYEGPVALNNDPEYLDSIGLIEFYETLLMTAKKYSIDDPAIGDVSGANNAIMFATSRVADLYMLLGNEAYADAGDPTIGYTTQNGDYSIAPSIFCFQNQMQSLLEEELVLMRGRDDSWTLDIDEPPIYNRAIWNLTSGEGELAYKMNYAVDTEEEAMTRFPQGHGDAWGHYLTAIRKYYDLLIHGNFTWVPRTENVIVAGIPVGVDYLDERKFAAVAAARARTGAEIVNLTYRDMYVDNPDGQWQGYKDDDNERAWGLSGWAARAGQGAYFDWLVGNAILPENSDETGIKKIDRKTVTELADVASRLSEVQASLDQADMCLNPLGVAKDAIPFDISPAEVDAGKTHFEQIYGRAVQALNNAIVVFDHANQNTQMLRRQQDTLEDFRDNAEDREADFNNRLIEIFGYPYADDIGLGKTYPSGYDGPDIYHYSYVDVSELMGIQPPPVHTFNMAVTDFLDVDSDGGLKKTTKDIVFHISTEGFGFIKPESWPGSRRSPGEIQMARSDLIQTTARFDKALIDYDNMIAQIEDEAEMLRAQFNLNALHINILYGVQGKQQSLNDSISGSRRRQLDFRTRGRMASIVANAVAAALPQNLGFIVGLANGTMGDWTSAARSAIRLAGSVVNESMSKMADSESLKELSVQQAKEIVQSQSNIEITALQANFAIEQKLKQIEQMIRGEASLRLELYTLQENILQSAGRYLAALARGERLLQDRTRFRQQTADDIREYRYKDMAFRIFRNDALQKYRAQFDLAARYVYLAAKAYDYDTGLLDSNTWAGEQFLTNIVKQRAIGEINGGIPMTGSGLAESMAQMSQNFSVLKSQMGFNNPQLEQNRFSLREEFFRIKSDYESDDMWKAALAENRVDNLWDIPEFRRYFSPFDTENMIEPAIVIPFTTNITSRLNYFGWPLGGGDSYYDSSRFATKVRGVGVWFSNYDNVNLVETPRIYVVPIGDDIIRAPYGNNLNIRSFKVIDQVLPVPFPLASTDLDENRGWLPIDTLSSVPGHLYDIRRHSRFRAHHDSGSGWSEEIEYDARLIGRSVWNTQWLLVIPGASLYYDPVEGLDRFVNGQVIPGEDGERNGNGVTDIKLIFETYSYEGN